MSNTIPFNRLLEYCLTYAMDNIGEATISMAKNDEFFEEEGLDYSKFINTHLGYRCEKSGKGFGDYIYTELNNLLPLKN